VKFAVPVPSSVFVERATVGAVDEFHTTPLEEIFVPDKVCPPDDAVVFVIEDAATVVVTVGAAI
jgi:hypothetical protein